MDPTKQHQRPTTAHIRLIGRRFHLLLKLGDGAAKPTDENSGWTTVDRPSDVAVTEWVGGQPEKVAIPCFLDGWKDSTEVGARMKAVQDLVRGPGGGKPPSFFILGPVPYSGRRFIVESIEYGDETIRGDLRNPKHATRLMRQDFILNVMRYVHPDRVRFGKAPKSAVDGGDSGGNGHRHHTKAGDTAQKVANLYYGPDDNLLETAQQIAALNGLRGTRSQISPGTSLILP